MVLNEVLRCLKIASILKGNFINTNSYLRTLT